MSPAEKRELVESVVDGFEAVELHGGIIGKGESAEIIFKYTGDPKLIDEIVADCGCTTSEKQMPEDGILKITYTDNVTNGLTDEQLDERYPAGVINISKGLSLFLADGEPTRKTNERGISVWNSEKVRTRLTFNVDIKFK